VQLGFLMESEDKNTVFWIERRRGGREKLKITIQATPIDVGRSARVPVVEAGEFGADVGDAGSWWRV